MAKRILMLSDASSTHTFTWAEGYSFMGFEPYLLSFEKPVENSNKIKDLILINPRFKKGKKKYLFHLGEVLSIIKKISPDIIFPHFIPNYGFLAYLQNISPYVLTIWGSDLLKTPSKSFVHFYITRKIFEKSKILVVDAKFMKDFIISKFRVKPQKILVIPFGIKREQREKGNKKNKKQKNLLFTNRKLEPLYNPFLVVKAIKTIIEKFKYKDFKLIWIKNGTLENKVKEVILKEGLFDVIELIPFQKREKLYEILSMSNIYISASFSDGTSVSLLEAMNFGLFPVVSDIIGNREWILDGLNGFLFNPRDHEELAEKIVKALDDEDMVKKARDMNREIIDKKANWEQNLDYLYKKMVEFKVLR